MLIKGKKPDCLPVHKISTQREWNSHLRQSKWKNPILEGYKYAGYLENSPGSSFKDVAKEFNISKARVSQMIALVKKLPAEITEYFLRKDQAVDFSYFTERKLRPLTLLKSDKEKIARFQKMLASIKSTG